MTRSCVSVPLPPGLTKLIQTYVDALSEDVYKAVCKSFQDINLEEVAKEMVRNFGDTARKCGIKNRCPTRQEIESCAARQTEGYEAMYFLGISPKTVQKIIAEGALYFFQVYCKNGIPDEKNLVAWLTSVREFVCAYKNQGGCSPSGSLLDYWWIFALLSLMGILVAFVLPNYI